MMRAGFKTLTLGVALAVGLSIGGGALAQSAGAKAAMARHEKFKQLGGAFKGLNDELKKDAPDKAVLQRNALAMKTLSTQLPTWFPRGSGKEAYPKSQSLANVWTDAAGFSAAAASMQVQVSKLYQISMTGDVSAIQAQVRPVGATCGACHKKFREDDKK